MFSERQMRQALRLGSRLRDEPGGSSGRRRELLRGLCEMAGAVAGLSALLNDDFAAVEPVAVTVPDTGGVIDAQSVGGTQFISALNPMASLFLREFAEHGMEPTSARRCTLVDDHTWYTSPYYRDQRRAKGFDDILLSAVALPGQQPSMAITALSRPLGRLAHFSQTEVEWVNLVHSELRWAYETAAPAIADGLVPRDPTAADSIGPMVHFPPRLQRVLRCLLDGRREKEVARQLGLSQHTVHQYVKMIYKELKVGSRAELLAQWVQLPDPSLPPFRGWDAPEVEGPS
jgi:DNA-binding CsgD family transcriptional regulator